MSTSSTDTLTVKNESPAMTLGEIRVEFIKSFKTMTLGRVFSGLIQATLFLLGLVSLHNYVKK